MPLQNPGEGISLGQDQGRSDDLLPKEAGTAEGTADVCPPSPNVQLSESLNGRPAEKTKSDSAVAVQEDVKQSMLGSYTGSTIEAPMSKLEKFAVPIVFTIFVVFRACDRVFMKCVQNDLNKPMYNLVFSNIIWPAAMQVITMCIIGGYVLTQRFQGNREYTCSFFLLGNPLASTSGAIPTYMLALFSLGDQLNAALSAPPSAFVSVPIQSVMTNFVLIWMAIVAYFWIKVRFKMVHYIGMLLVVLASIVQFLPYLLKNDCSPDGLDVTITDPVECFSAYHTSSGTWVILEPASAMAFFYVLFLVSTFPAAVSNVYKQKVLQGVDADIFYVTWWSGWFQLMWGWVCIPLMWIPLPGQDTMKPADTFKIVGDTIACLAGDASKGEGCGGSPPPWIYVILYFAFNATFNLCITWLIKRISATWVQVATVLCLNLCNIFSAQTWIMGDSAEPMTLWDWGGAIIVSFALVIYNLQPEVTVDGKEILQQQNGSFVADGHTNLIEKLAGTTENGCAVKPGSFVGSFVGSIVGN